MNKREYILDEFNNPIIIHTEKDFIGMRKAGKLASKVLDYVGQFVKVGISTNELDKHCHDFIIANNAIPAPLNYKGFPKSICTSVNHVVCHGIPSEKVLREATTDKDNLENETENVSDVEVASSWAYQTKLFPKLFATVIYIVLLFVSFGTIFTQLMIFAKGSWK